MLLRFNLRRLYSTLRINVANQSLVFHHFWLRDHCLCKDCLHPDTLQRLHDTSAIPTTIEPASIEQNDQHVKIKWKHDGHESIFQIQWLIKHSYSNKPSPPQKSDKIYWNASALKNKLPAVKYDQVMQSDEGVKKWLVNIHQYGLSLVEGVPLNNKDNRRLAERIGVIRSTIFGDFWEFQPNLEHADTAYTTLALGTHNDNAYFSEPSGLQMFHIVQFNGTGGTNQFTDGFHVAELLRKQNPEAFEILSTIPVPTRYIDEKAGHNFRPQVYRPIIVTAKDDNQGVPKGTLLQVRYNNDDRAPLTNISSELVPKFYDALRAWHSILRSPDNEIHYQLHPGTAIFIENYRVLHGRSAFTGIRKMVGCYIPYDDYKSRLRNLSGIN